MMVNYQSRNLYNYLYFDPTIDFRILFQTELTLSNFDGLWTLCKACCGTTGPNWKMSLRSSFSVRWRFMPDNSTLQRASYWRLWTQQSSWRGSSLKNIKHGKMTQEWISRVFFNESEIQVEQQFKLFNSLQLCETALACYSIENFHQNFRQSCTQSSKLINTALD